MPSKILAALDGSLISTRVASWAHDLARATAAQLAFLHVVEPLPDFLSPFLSMAPSGVHETRLADGQRVLEGICRELGIQDAELLVQLGVAPEVICAETQECGADHLVIGSHGHGGRPKVLLGSVAMRAANLTDVNVTIVR